MKLMPRKKPRIISKSKAYGLKDCALYNLTTKKRLLARLGITSERLRELLADDNYRIFSLEKSDGSTRQIQAPKFNLDIVNTRIASLLVRVAPPPYLHSGIKGRSNVTNARMHISRYPALTADIQNFYPSVTQASVFQFFSSTMKAPPDVAGILANLCCYCGHVPTGSRISMPLAYWANQQMFERLEALCVRHMITMTVYVDDLTFSGEAVNKQFSRAVQRIISNAGLTLHPKKTRLYSADEPKLITGVVVGDKGCSVRNKHHKAIYNAFFRVANR